MPSINGQQPSTTLTSLRMILHSPNQESPFRLYLGLFMIFLFFSKGKDKKNGEPKEICLINQV